MTIEPVTFGIITACERLKTYMVHDGLERITVSSRPADR